MESFTTLTGLAVPLDRVNVNTDEITPARFLKSIRRTGFANALFANWRYLKDGTPNPDFVLNQPRYQGVSILLAGDNFGCGSSREHAPWAILEYGSPVLRTRSSPTGATSKMALLILISCSTSRATRV